MSEETRIAKFRLPEWCLYACVLVAPLRCYGLGSLGWGNFSFFRFFGILMILFEIAEMASYRYLKITKSMSGIFLIIGSSIIAAVYSTLLSSSNFSAMLIGLVWLLFAMAIVSRRPFMIGRLIVLYVISAILPVFFGLYQYASYVLIKQLPPFPLSQFLVSEGKTGLLFQSEVRIMSFFLDPSYYGMFLISIIIIISCALINQEKFGPIKNKAIRILFVIMLFASIISLFTSLSITAFLGLFVGIGIVVLNSKNRKTIWKMLGLLAILLLLLFIIDKVFNLNFWDTLLWKLQVNTEKHGIIGGRGDHMMNAIEKWLSSPLFGVGFGDLALNGVSFSGHNTLLTVLGQQGLIGFIIHLYFLFILPLLYFKRGRKDVYDLIAFAPLMAVFVQSMGYDLIYKIDSHYVLMLISFSIFEIVRKDGETEILKENRNARYNTI